MKHVHPRLPRQDRGAEKGSVPCQLSQAELRRGVYLLNDGDRYDWPIHNNSIGMQTGFIAETFGVTVE